MPESLILNYLKIVLTAYKILKKKRRSIQTCALSMIYQILL